MPLGWYQELRVQKQCCGASLMVLPVSCKSPVPAPEERQLRGKCILAVRWEVQWKSVNRLGQGEAVVFSGSGVQREKDPGEVVGPIQAAALRSEHIIKAAVDALD